MVVELLSHPVLLYDQIVHNVVEDASKSSCVLEVVNYEVSNTSLLHAPFACSNYTKGFFFGGPLCGLLALDVGCPFGFRVTDVDGVIMQAELSPSPFMACSRFSSINRWDALSSNDMEYSSLYN